MAVKNYLINDKWLDLDKQNIVEVKSTDGVIESVKLNGEEYGGGGGSSDFSTAMVSIKSNATNEIICGLAIAQEADPPFIEHSMTLSTRSLYENDEYTYRAILYKGRCELSVQNANSINGSGNVDVLNNTSAIITGDCTITIS